MVTCGCSMIYLSTQNSMFTNDSLYFFLEKSLLSPSKTTQVIFTLAVHIQITQTSYNVELGITRYLPIL